MFDNVVVGAADTAAGARALRRGAEVWRASLGGTVRIVAASAVEPVEAITRVAAEEAADLIVVGSQADHGSRRLSSVPQAVMDRVERAVLVV